MKEVVDGEFILWDKNAGGFVCTDWGAYYSTDEHRAKSGSLFQVEAMTQYFPDRFSVIEVVH